MHPPTSAGVACDGGTGNTCEVHSNAAGTLSVKATISSLAVNETVAVVVTMNVSSDLCNLPDTDEMYTGNISAVSLNRADPDRTNDTFGIAFPDVDGNGAIDICAWPITNFAVTAHNPLLFRTEAASLI
ncbi:MAG: hypothetical protein JXX14_06640 [Deltaproteobacteria bacterium]|nr:hypothetical protein [Deltaproteobacteria bacterium]